MPVDPADLMVLHACGPGPGTTNVLMAKCGAIIHADDVTPCPDPYCRVCRDHDGEVMDPPPAASGGPTTDG